MQQAEQKFVLNHPDIIKVIVASQGKGLPDDYIDKVLNDAIGEIKNETTKEAVDFVAHCLIKKTKEWVKANKGTTWFGRAWRNVFGWLNFK